MAESKYKGLLYSPEVLGGIGLLTSGLSGGNPGQALPSLIQGMQTAAMFRKQEDEDEKQKLIKEYADLVPADQKNAFLIAPKQWLAKNVFAQDKSAKFETFLSEDGKDKVTINTASKSGLAKATDLINNKGYDKISQSITGKNTADLTAIPKGARTDAAKKIAGAETIMVTLNNMEGLYEPEFLTYMGQGKAAVAAQMSKLGITINNEELENFMIRKGKWEAVNQQFFNAYRKEITGVAAGEKEIAFLEQSVPNINDAPKIYLAKVKLQKELTQKIIERNKEYLTKGFERTLDDEGKPTGKYKEYLEKNIIKPSETQAKEMAQAFADLGYDNTKINFQMNQTFGAGNWEEFFK